MQIVLNMSGVSCATGDAVRLHNGLLLPNGGFDANPLNSLVCGSGSSVVYTSTGQTLTVTLRTGASSQGGLGFVAAVSFVTGNAIAGPCLYGLHDTFTGLSRNVTFDLLCDNGVVCDASGTDTSCCNSRGGRAACPGAMCAIKGCAGGTDFCCGEGVTWQDTIADCGGKHNTVYVWA